MQESYGIEEFITNYFNYLQNRFLDEEIAMYAKETYLNIHNIFMRNNVKEIEALQGLPDATIYTYLCDLVTDFNGNILSKLKFFQQTDHYEPIYSKYYLILLALAYNANTKKFATYYLILNLIKLLMSGHIMPNVVVGLFCSTVLPAIEEKKKIYQEYDIKQAIYLIRMLMDRQESYQKDLPLHLAFSYRYPDNEVLNFGLELLALGVEPLDILFHALPPLNNDYRLLNYCIEMSAKNNTYEKIINYNASHFPGYTKKNLFYTVVNSIPAVYFFQNNRVAYKDAVHMGYKPRAICRSVDFSNFVNRYPGVMFFPDRGDNYITMRTLGYKPGAREKQRIAHQNIIQLLNIAFALLEEPPYGAMPATLPTEIKKQSSQLLGYSINGLIDSLEDKYFTLEAIDMALKDLIVLINTFRHQVKDLSTEWFKSINNYLELPDDCEMITITLGKGFQSLDATKQVELAEPMAKLSLSTAP
jgi:hypothetical protein